jgi:hypothetical protein
LSLLRWKIKDKVSDFASINPRDVEGPEKATRGE